MSAGNEPAYPTPHAYNANGQVEYGRMGLTKRELFAMAAMQGILSNANAYGEFMEFSVMAVGAADALIAELSKDPQP